MSLGKPDLYIGGQLMQTAAADPRPALAGLRISWGNDSRLDMDPAAKLSGQLLVRGAMPDFLEVGAPVGLVDPVSARCLFAGNLAPLKAAPDESVKGAQRVSFTAASPIHELAKHTVLDFDWPYAEEPADRFNRLAAAMPRGWALTGSTGLAGVQQGRQRYQSEKWLTLAERFCRSYTYRYNDTSTYTPGGGLAKRLTFGGDRSKSMGSVPGPGTAGIWHTGSGKPTSASGVAVLPLRAIGTGIDWEKTPEDIVTDVQVTTWGGATAEPESSEFEYLMSVYVNNNAMQDAYGYRQMRLETSMSASPSTVAARLPVMVNYWLDAQTGWRPTSLQLPDSREIATDPLLNLLAVETRPNAAISVPNTDLAPGLIRSFVLAGQATWTGKKWTTDLTLGRTL